MKTKSTGKTLLLTAIFMSAATMLAKVLGLVRDSMLAANFGTGLEADAFLSATKLPTTMFDMVVGGVISASFIPIFTSVNAKKDTKSAMEFANKFITLILMITLAIAIIGIVFARPLTNFIAPGYDGQKFELTVKLTSIMFPMIIFTGLAFSFVGILQSMGEYKIPSIISLVSNLAIILYFPLFCSKYGVVGLAVTMVIAWSLQALVQIPSLIKFKYKFKFDFKIKDENIISALKLAGPMLISTWVQPLCNLITARLASGTDGAYASLELANRLYIIVTGVFSFVVTNLIFPKLSKANVSNNKDEARGLVSNSLKALLIIILPIMAGIIILATPVTSIIYEHGKLNSNGVMVVSDALRFYSIGMVGLAANEVLSKTFFSMRDSKTPMVNAILSMVFNVVCAYTLFDKMGTSGLALSVAMGSIFNAILNLFCLIRKDNKIFKIADLTEILKMIISALIMSVVVMIVYKLMYVPQRDMLNQIVICVSCAISGAVVYAVVLIATKVELIRQLLQKGDRK